MFYLELISRIVTILVGLSTLTERGAAYIQRRGTQAKKDPSASLTASDGSRDDCESNH